MSTPVEPIPVATAIPVPRSSSSSSGQMHSAPPPPMAPHVSANRHPNDGQAPPADDYFRPRSLRQCLRRTLVDIYLGHFDTFLALTLVVSLPALLGYRWMRAGYWGAGWLFRYVILPLTRLVADGAAVSATAHIYLRQGQHVSFKIPFQTGFSHRLGSRWILQVLRSQRIIGFLLVPTGVFTFTSPLLMLQKASLVGSMVSSWRLVWFDAIGTLVTIGIATFGVTPVLSWLLRQCNFMMGNFDSDAKQLGQDDDSFDMFWSHRQQIQELMALPLISCLWTVLFLNICMKRKRNPLSREALARDMGVQLPPSLSASIY